MASFHSLGEYLAVMDKLYEMKKNVNLWLGLIRNSNGGLLTIAVQFLSFLSPVGHTANRQLNLRVVKLSQCLQ